MLLNSKRSTIWNHFTKKSSTIAKCSYCGHELSYSGGSTSNLLRHLKTKHITMPLTKQLRNQNNLSSDNEEYIDDPSSIPSVATISTSANTASSTVLPETVSLSTSNQSRQSTITQFVSKPISLSKSKAIDLRISKFIKISMPFHWSKKQNFGI